MRKGWVAGMVAAAMLVAGGAWAADTNTLTVTASVAGTCKFAAPKTSTLGFGALDPSLTTDPAATATTQFWCTKGVNTAAITADNGGNWSGSARQMRDTVSGDLIPYALTLTPDGLANAGPASPRTLTIAGTIVNADYINKSAGSYSDTVLLSITP